MASKTIAFGAIDQTAEPLCAKIAPTEPAISIGFLNYAPLCEKIQKRISRTREFFVEDLLFRGQDTNAGVSIGALDEPVYGAWPELFLSPAADGESDVSGRPDDLFLVGGTDQVIERLGLGAGNKVVVAGHQVEQGAGDLAQIDNVPAQR